MTCQRCGQQQCKCRMLGAPSVAPKFLPEGDTELAKWQALYFDACGECMRKTEKNRKLREALRKISQMKFWNDPDKGLIMRADEVISCATEALATLEGK